MQPEVLAQSLCLLLIVLQCICSVYSTEETFQFDVKPGGETHTFAEKMGDFSCSFTYSCQGGTNEQWTMSIKHETDYTCDVARPFGDSYLMFEKFHLKIKGARLKDAVVFSNKDLKELPSDEYEKDFSKTAVKSSKKFNNKMHRVIALATNNKEDL